MLARIVLPCGNPVRISVLAVFLGPPSRTLVLEIPSNGFYDLAFNYVNLHAELCYLKSQYFF